MGGHQADAAEQATQLPRVNDRRNDKLATDDLNPAWRRSGYGCALYERVGRISAARSADT